MTNRKLISPSIEFKINDKTGVALIDTGATTSLVSEEFINEIRGNDNTATVRDASGNIIPIIGKVRCRIVTTDGDIWEDFLIFKKPIRTNVKMFLGMNVLQNAVIDLGGKTIKFQAKSEKRANSRYTVIEIRNRDIVNHETGDNGLGLGSKENPGRDSHIEDRNTTHSDHDRQNLSFFMGEGRENKCESSSSGLGKSEMPLVTRFSEEGQATASETEFCTDDNEFNIHSLEELVIPPNSLTIQAVRVCNPNSKLNGKCVVLNNYESKNGIATPNIITYARNERLIMSFMNITDEKVIINKGSKLTTASIYNDKTEQLRSIENNTPRSENVDKLTRINKNHVNCEDSTKTNQILDLLNQNRGAIWLKGEPLGSFKGDELEIKLKSDDIINKAPYQIPHYKQKNVYDQIKDLEKNNIIERSKSNFNSPLHVVDKRNGEYRICVDYRALNSITIPITFPMPRITELLNSLGEAKVISSLDLKSAYHQCYVKPEDRHKTAFTVKNTKFHWNRVPYGLVSSPAYFSRIINETLYDLIGDHVFCYLDDILIVTKNENDHINRIRDVLERLARADLKLNLEKCTFFAKKIKFLGYYISEKGLTMDDEKANSIERMENPKNKKQLQAFLGAVNYYRIFIKNLAMIAEPLYRLLRKNVKYEWREEHSIAVKTLKEKLADTPILKYPNFEKPFILCTDASLTGIGACLMQLHNKVLHPISFMSKRLTPAQQNYSTTKREALSLIYALEHFRQIILCYPVTVYTDHFPLKGILSKPTKDACLNRWSLLVQEYNIDLKYIPGKDNILADVLSRLTNKDSAEGIPEKLDESLLEKINRLEDELNSYIPEKLPWDERKLRTWQKKDEFCMLIRKNLRENLKATSQLVKVKIIKDILFVHRKLKRGKFTDEFLVPYVPNGLMEDAFKIIHIDSTAGHQGFDRTLKLFQKNFFNKDEVKTLKELGKACVSCIKAKATTSEVPLKTYPIPTRPFHTISIDILGPLPITTENSRFILVTRDFTTRYTILKAIPSKNTATIIKCFREIIADYGASEVVLSDNAKEFVSEEFRKFLNFFNIRKKEIIPYHPQSQGLAERINREVNKLLRIYTNDLQIQDWDELIPTLQLTINNTYNESIKETPFYALYGYDSASVVLNPPKINYDESELNTHLQRISNVRMHCRKELLKAQAKYTEYSNKNKTSKNIKVNDRVYAKLDKHVQHSKLNYPISGPFIVTEKIRNGFNLKEIGTDNTYLVHPDNIITRS